METKRGSAPGRQGKRRQFTDEFKAGAVRLVLDEVLASGPAHGNNDRIERAG